MHPLYWLGLIFFFSIIEGFTFNLVTIWFAIGSLIAFGFSFWIDDLTIQLTIALCSTLLSLIFGFKYWKKLITFRKREGDTNMDSLIGKSYHISKSADKVTLKAEVLLGDIPWECMPSDEETLFKVGDIVVVEEIKGNTLIVRKRVEINK